MSNVGSHALGAGTVTVRRKPALTYPSPTRSTAILHVESTLFTSRNATTFPLPMSPPTRLSQTPEPSQRSTGAHKSRRHHMTTPLLPLYHPFGTLALSLPDLDPTVFGLPAPVAVFGDPTRRYSGRQRRPAAKVRDAEDPAPSQQPLRAAETPTPESEIKEKPSPRRRRGGKRKRKEPEDGDATYPAKRPRNPRSSGVVSGLSGTRAVSREEGSPTLSNGTSPALDASGGDRCEEKKRERRTTRSRGVAMRRGSTTSEETATSASGLNHATAGGEPAEAEEPTASDVALRAEAQKTNSVLERPES